MNYKVGTFSKTRYISLSDHYKLFRHFRWSKLFETCKFGFLDPGFLDPDSGPRLKDIGEV